MIKYNSLFQIILLLIFSLNAKTGTEKIEIREKQLKTISFIDSLGPCESLFLTKESLKLYAGDINGYVHIIDGDDRRSLKKVKSVKLAEGYCTGIAQDSKKNLYIGVSTGDGKWSKQDCYIIKTDSLLNLKDTIAGPYTLINGVVMPDDSTLYFTAGKFSLFSKSGALYKMEIRDNDLKKPIPLTPNCTGPNGLFYDTTHKKLLFTQTLKGIYEYSPETDTLMEIVRNSRLTDSSDDLCLDRERNIWIANPPRGFIKCYDQKMNKMTYYDIPAYGVASSCRIRIEEGQEVLYIAEISSPAERYNGRGVVSVVLDELKSYK